MNQTPHIIRQPELCAMLGICRTTAWRWEREGKLPPRRRLGPNSVGWLSSEIEEYLKTLPPVSERDAAEVA